MTTISFMKGKNVLLLMFVFFLFLPQIELKFGTENIMPSSVVAALTHDIFIKGCQINFSIDGQKDLEVTSLYPDIPFRSMADCFDDFATRAAQRSQPPQPQSPPPPPQKAHFQCQNSHVEGNTIEGIGDYTVKHSIMFNYQPIES